MAGESVGRERGDDTPRERVAAALAGFPRRALDPAGRRPAAVAIVLGERPGGGPGFLLTRRAAGLRRHAGQWALPGGRAEPGEDAPAAAQREAAEEVGIAPGRTEVLGLLDDYPTRSGYLITPVVVWAGAELASARPAEAEVARIFTVPLADLDVAARFVRIPESDRPVIQLPLLGTLIHAPTGAILYQFAEVARRGRVTRVAGFDQPVFAWR